MLFKYVSFPSDPHTDERQAIINIGLFSGLRCALHPQRDQSLPSYSNGLLALVYKLGLIFLPLCPECVGVVDGSATAPIFLYFPNSSTHRHSTMWWMVLLHFYFLFLSLLCMGEITCLVCSCAFSAFASSLPSDLILLNPYGILTEILSLPEAILVSLHACLSMAGGEAGGSNVSPLIRCLLFRLVSRFLSSFWTYPYQFILPIDGHFIRLDFQHGPTHHTQALHMIVISFNIALFHCTHTCLFVLFWRKGNRLSPSIYVFLWDKSRLDPPLLIWKLSCPSL